MRNPAPLALLLLLAAAAPAAAETASLVLDVNVQDEGLALSSSPRLFAAGGKLFFAAGGKLFFAASTPDIGMSPG